MDVRIGNDLSQIPFDHDVWRTKYQADIIGKRLRAAIHRCGYTNKEILLSYDQIRYDEALSAEQRSVLREWPESAFSRLLTGDKRGRKDIYRAEVLAFVSIIKITLGEALGTAGFGIVDPMSKAEYAKGFETTLKEAASKTSGELWGWGEFLPCGFETEPFMRAHHAGIFSAETLTATQDVSKRIRETFDAIGATSIKQFKNGGTSRRWLFNHLIFEDDLSRIFTCTGEYANVHRSTRDECLANLANILNTAAYRAALWVIPGSRRDLPTSNRTLQDIDSMVAFDRHFSFWRSHSGVISYTDDQGWVKRKLTALLDLATRAKRYSGQDLLDAGRRYRPGVRPIC